VNDLKQRRQRLRRAARNWLLACGVSSVAAVGLIQVPAEAIVYNLVNVNVSFPYLSVFNGTASITGSFEYTGGPSAGTFLLSNVDIDYDATAFLNFDFSYSTGYVVNNGANTFLVFNTTSAVSPSLPTCSEPQPSTPCLRISLAAPLTGTAFQTVAIDSGTGNAGGASRFDFGGVLPLTARPGFTNVIQAVPSPFTAGLLAPLLFVTGYRKRLARRRAHAERPVPAPAGSPVEPI
jgi:hypothetical protein